MASLSVEPLRRDGAISAALNDAKVLLSNALKDCKSGANNDDETNEKASREDVQPQDTDPDDLAAAFFAKQAKPPTLAVEEWAQVIIYKEKETNGLSAGAGEDNTAKTLPLQDQDEVESLHDEFHKALEQC